MQLNIVVLGGNLTQDPELKYTPGGDAVINFTVASNRTYRTKNGEQKEEVAFVGCVAWRKTAELINQYLKKGSGVVVIGRLQTDIWEDAQGKKQKKTKVLVENIQFVSGTKREETEPATDESFPGEES